MSDGDLRRLLVVSHRPLDFGGGGSARWRYFAEALPEFGWEVRTVANTSRGIGTNESSTDAAEARTARARATVMGAVGRVARPATRRLLGIQPEALAPSAIWSWTGRRTVLAAIERERPDVVLATVPPIAAMFAASAVLARRPEPFVVEFRDLWAGNPYYDAGGRSLARLERRALDSADLITTVTDGCRARFLDLHPEATARLAVIPNGFDPALLEQRSSRPELGSDGRTTLIHAGGLYADRTAVVLLEVLSRPEFAARVRLHLVGPIDDVSLRAVERARSSGVPVDVESPVSWEKSVARIKAAHVAVVINSPGTGGDMALPGKLFEALALGRPILALTSRGSDTDRLLGSLGQALCCAPPDDPGQTAVALRYVLDGPPPAVSADALAPWSRRGLAARFARLLDGLAQARQPNRRFRTSNSTSA